MDEKILRFTLVFFSNGSARDGFYRDLKRGGAGLFRSNRFSTVGAVIIIAEKYDTNKSSGGDEFNSFKEGVAMLIIIYMLVWILFAVIARILFATGNFNEMATTVFGFLFSTLFFAGIVAVLPWWVDKQYSRFSPPK
jgi:hypothetical protein